MPNDAPEQNEAAYDAWYRARAEDAIADSRPSVPTALVEAYRARRRAAALEVDQSSQSSSSKT